MTTTTASTDEATITTAAVPMQRTPLDAIKEVFAGFSLKPNDPDASPQFFKDNVEIIQRFEKLASEKNMLDAEVRGFRNELAVVKLLIERGVADSNLKSVAAVGSTDAAPVSKKMRELPINDLTTKNAHVRGDGRVIRDMFVFKVKKPSESRYPWDYYTLVKRLPGDELMSRDPSADCASPLIAGQ